ncbi:cupin domain-containing protein [Lignipirellula cremea]|uniref:Cupin domain protein n=1 Tax=Lignipirellula cremea TaxID=2528010 RepID=A0A518E0Z9_9BACT|nr:cupin [Lignipirellula cremea]QDU97766.1 Cupin domain protein [Lignipirellula cremea]
MQPGNLFAQLPTDLSAEVFETLASGDNVRVERIVSHGQASPDGFWYDQPQHEWVVLLRGSAHLELREPAAEVSLTPGDYLLIAAHRPHRVNGTALGQPTIWLAVHFGPSPAAAAEPPAK